VSTETEMEITGWVFTLIGIFGLAMAISNITECQSYLEYTLFLVVGLFSSIEAFVGMLFLIVCDA